MFEFAALLLLLIVLALLIALVFANDAFSAVEEDIVESSLSIFDAADAAAFAVLLLVVVVDFIARESDVDDDPSPVLIFVLKGASLFAILVAACKFLDDVSTS